MGIIARWGGEGLADGTVLTTGAAGIGDTPLGVAGSTVAVHQSGTRSPRIRITQDAGQAAHVRWGTNVFGEAGVTVFAARFYVELTGLASASFTICSGWTAANSSQAWRVDVAGLGAGEQAGQVRLRDAGNTQVDASGAVVLEPGTEYRVEITANDGAMTVRVYAGDTAAALMTLSGMVGASIDAIRFGTVTASPTAPTFYLDELAAADTAQEIGPGTPTPSSLSYWDGTTEHPLSFADGGYVLTGGGSEIILPAGDVTTRALSFRLPAGDRANAPDTMAFYWNAGTDVVPSWRKTTWTNEYGELRVQPSSPGRVPFRVKYLAGQTADLSQWTDVNNVPLARVTAAGAGHFAALYAGGAQVATGHGWEPGDYGFKAWVGDPGMTAGALAVNAGVLYLWRMRLPAPVTVNNVVLQLGGGGVLTAGQNFVGLYDESGALLAGSQDMSDLWGVAGLQVCPLTAAVELAAGWVFAAALFNGSSMMNMARYGQSTSYSNVGLPPERKRFAMYGSGLTSLPAAVPVAALVDAAPAAYWAGLA